MSDPTAVIDKPFTVALCLKYCENMWGETLVTGKGFGEESVTLSMDGRMVQWTKVPTSKPNVFGSILGPTGWKEITDFCKLYSYLLTSIM